MDIQLSQLAHAGVDDRDGLADGRQMAGSTQFVVVGWTRDGADYVRLCLRHQTCSKVASTTRDTQVCPLCAIEPELQAALDRYDALHRQLTRGL